MNIEKNMGKPYKSLIGVGEDDYEKDSADYIILYIPLCSWMHLKTEFRKSFGN
jgi:hypothetical protein